METAGRHVLLPAMLGLHLGQKGRRLRMERSVFDQVLQAIDDEIAKLERARAVLAGVRVTSPTRPVATASVDPITPRRQLSAKARQAIAEAQRRRWAKVKSEQKPAPVTPMQKEAAAS
jgi:hypothetical protein